MPHKIGTRRALLKDTRLGFDDLYREVINDPDAILAYFGQDTTDNGVIEAWNVKHGMPDGTERVTNGTFDTDTDWTKDDAAITISGGTANWSGAQAGLAILSQTVTGIVSGDVIAITWTMLNRSSGNITPSFGNQSGTLQAANGTYTSYIAWNGTGGQSLKFVGDSSFTGSIDNISLQKVTTGRNLVADPFFDTATPNPYWNEGTGWTIGSGKLTGVNASTSTTQNILTIGTEYEVIFKVSGFVSGSVRPVCGTTGLGTARTADGIYRERITCAGGTFLSLFPVAFNGDIEFVIVRPVSNATNGRYAPNNLVLNPFFANWTGDNPDNWTVANEDANNYITETVTGHWNLVSDNSGAITMSQAILAVGKTYVITVHISTVTSGSVTLTDGTNSTTLGTVGVHKVVWTAAGTSLSILRTAACNVQGDYVRVEQILIEPSSNYPKAESLDTSGDGVMDKDNWTAQNNATLTNPSVDVLRVARSDTNDASAFQACFTIGLRYRITGEGRSDGNATPRIIATTVVDLTTSTDWQSFDFEVVITAGVNVFFRAFNASGTEYVEWRNLSVTEVNPLNADATAITIGAAGNANVPRMLEGNGATSFVDIYSAELNAILPRDELAVMCLASFDDPASGVNERVITLDIDGNNLIRLYKGSTDLDSWLYIGDSTSDSYTQASVSGLHLLALSLSIKNDELRYQYDANEVGTDSGTKRMVGNLASTGTVLMARTTVPNEPLDGKAAVFVVFENGEITEATFANYARLAGVPS